VLVPNCFLDEASFHTGQTPIWTQGDVIGEGTDQSTGKQMVVCNLGGDHCECHMDGANVCLATSPKEYAMGSEGGHGHGWKKYKANFKPSPLNQPLRALNKKIFNDLEKE